MFAENQIALLHKETNSLQAKTVASAKELQGLIDKIEADAAVVDEGREVVELEKETIAEATRQAEAVKNEVEAELEKAIPALDDATEALNTLTTKDMTQLKQLQKPANVIRLVMEAVCIMKGVL